MSASEKQVIVPDLRQYAENRNKFPPEELEKYAGQYVAWSTDGTRILASGPDEETVEKRLAEAGIDPALAVMDYIPPADLVLLL